MHHPESEVSRDALRLVTTPSRRLPRPQRTQSSCQAYWMRVVSADRGALRICLWTGRIDGTIPDDLKPSTGGRFKPGSQWRTEAVNVR